MAPTVIPAKAGIQFFRSPAWMPASASMTNWVTLVATYGALVHLAHISPDLASPEGEGFQPSPKETLTCAFLLRPLLAQTTPPRSAPPAPRPARGYWRGLSRFMDLHHGTPLS